MDEIPEKNLILYNILYTIFRRKVALISLSATSFLLIIFSTFLTTPTYKGTTKILIRSNPQQQLILFKDLATPGREAPKINPASNLIQILTGQQMAQQVVDRFRLDERLRRKKEKPEELHGLIKQFLVKLVKAVTYPITLVKNLVGVEGQPSNFFSDAVDRLVEEAEDIQLEEESNVINLSIWEETPKLSSDIANYMAELLIERSAELEQVNTKQAYDFTREQLKAAEATLRDSEAELLQFREKNGIVSLEEQKKAKLDELHMVENQHINVKTELSEAKARLDELRKRISAQKKLLSDSPIFANNLVVKELINSLNSAEIRLAGELEKFTESSKSVKSLRAQTSESREKIEKELKAMMKSDSAILASIHPDLPKDYAQITANFAALAAKQVSLEKEMNALKAEAFLLSVLETKLESLNRRRETNESLYKNLLDKHSELEVLKASQMSGHDLKIIDKAFVPEDASPDRPNWILVIPFGFMASLLLSVGSVFFIEYWDETFKSAGEIEQRLGLTVLCTVPDMN
ncbi:MAG: hypothetical protein HWN68_00400 [Desulfobacterales bacterium]|nr:hypothetical protein [Desulfobacterales bacterium]